LISHIYLVNFFNIGKARQVCQLVIDSLWTQLVEQEWNLFNHLLKLVLVQICVHEVQYLVALAYMKQSRNNFLLNYLLKLNELFWKKLWKLAQTLLGIILLALVVVRINILLETCENKVHLLLNRIFLVFVYEVVENIKNKVVEWFEDNLNYLLLFKFTELFWIKH
jgi:hypothetical protein